MRRSLLSGVAVGALSVSVLQTSAQASEGWRQVRVSSTLITTDYGPTTSPVCDSGGRCLQSFKLTDRSSGGMQGTFVEDSTIWFGSGRPNDESPAVQVTIVGLFTGTVQGCGAGSMALSFPLVGGAETDVSGTFDVVPHSGTRDLAEASGSGTFHFDGQTTQSSLKLKCRPQ